MSISLAHTASYAGGSAGSGDGGNDGAGVMAKASDCTQVMTFLTDGLTIGTYQSTVDYSLATGMTYSLLTILYSTGPYLLVQNAEFHDGTAGSNGTNAEAYAIAFNASMK